MLKHSFQLVNAMRPCLCCSIAVFNYIGGVLTVRATGFSVVNLVRMPSKDRKKEVFFFTCPRPRCKYCTAHKRTCFRCSSLDYIVWPCFFFQWKTWMLLFSGWYSFNAGRYSWSFTTFCSKTMYIVFMGQLKWLYKLWSLQLQP